uniref:PH domain-containing protein n=1 Tax=Alistipes sp. TaxID=1872444 RepID=UPI004055D18E
MEEKIYKYHFSRRMILLSCGYMVGFTLLAVALYFLYEGGYLSAWFTSSILALLLLMALSIPRKVRLSPERLCIDCLMDITELPLREIASVRLLPKNESRGFIPLFGGYGFFGYYGHYLDIIQVERVKVYASEWRDLVEITDIYESRLIISVQDPERFIATLEQLLDGE